MWHEKQESITLPGQATCPPNGLQGAYVENMVLRPPSGNHDMDFLSGSSRKRKLAAMDQSNAFPDSAFKYCTPWESNREQATLRTGINAQRNTQNLCSNHENLAEPFTFRNQFQNDHATRQTSYANLYRNRIDKRPPSSLHYKESFSLGKMPVGETFTASNWQPPASNMHCQTEPHTSLSSLRSNHEHIKKAQFDPGLHYLMGFEIQNNVLSDAKQLERCNTPSGNLRPAEMLQQCFLQPNMFCDDLDERSCFQEPKKYPNTSDSESKQSDYSSTDIGNNNTSTGGKASLGAMGCTEPDKSHRLLQDVQFSGDPLGTRWGYASENNKQGQGDCIVRVEEKTEASDMKTTKTGSCDIRVKGKTETLDVENLKSSFIEEFSPKGGSPANTVGDVQKNDPSRSSLKLHSGKAASSMAEKLWDGSLQLNSSVIVSTVAFFKSGEKLLDINWSEFVEVKGKVRLEAFEKYIQELTRSRNRGLMVISLCWREGSSETGRTGMKEIAKGYDKGERVGFAQLSQGIDLYLCPRSDAIITILAKYGFFKGMAAVEDNQDSLIGCVVWRRNRASTSSVARKSESKNASLSEQAMNSLPETQQTAERKMSPQPAQGILPVPVTVPYCVESAVRNGSDVKNVDSSAVQLEVAKSFSATNSLLNSPFTSQSSVLVEPHGSPHSNTTAFQLPQGQLSEAEAPRVSLESQKPVIPLPSDVQKQNAPTFYDDDLPEFDFGSACGISRSRTSNPSDSVMFDSRHRTEGRDGLLPPTTTIVPIPSQKPDPLAFDSLLSSASQGVPLLKKQCEHESKNPSMPKLEENQCVQSKPAIAPVSSTTFAPSKNFFDDDDMPEWCPPDIHKSQSFAENSTFKSLPSGTMQSILPLKSPAATHSMSSSQAFPHGFHFPVGVTAKAPQPTTSPRFLNSSVEFNSNFVLRPRPISSDRRLPFHPADKRGWRPL